MKRWLLFSVFLIALAARLIPGPRTIDDAYITFRYARNILAGNGFVYNPGERVLGTTTQVFAILLTALGAFFGSAQAPFPSMALFVNTFADAATCLLLFNLARQLGSERAGIAVALVWAVAPFSVTFAIGGLETSVYVLFLTATIYSYLKRNYLLSALLAAIALLTRPDALILVGPLALDRFFVALRSGRGKLFGFPTNEVLVFTLPLAAWFIFATLYFGNPIPHSIAAKSLAYRLSPEAGLVRLMQHYATPFLGHLTFGNSWIGVGLVLYPFLFIVGARQALRTQPRAWPFILFPWLYFAAFAIANPLIFRWYLTPPLPAYMLFILLGADRFLRDVLGLIRIAGVSWLSTLLKTLPVLILILFPFVMTLRGWTPHPDHGLKRPAPEMAWYKLELLYRQAAEFIKPKLNQNSILAAGDVGVLGYYTQARILDTVGLNSAITTDYYPLDAKYYITNYAIPPDLIVDTQPDYLVILEVYGRAGLLKDTRFWDRYQQIEKIPTDIYGSDGMLIFYRTGSP